MQNKQCTDVKSIRIVAFGELLWDMLPSGKKLGGAPVNFSYHAQTLGADVRPLTRIGCDNLGAEIVDRLDALEIPQEALQISQTTPTGTVDVKLDTKGCPTYRIVENVAWDEIRVDENDLAQIVQFLSEPNVGSAFYFGSLALRTNNNKNAVARILNALPSHILRVCDLNLRSPFYDRPTIEFTLGSADVFKLNDAEAVELDKMFSDKTPKLLDSLADTEGALTTAIRTDFERVKVVLVQWAQNWLKTFNLQTIILTCASEGAFLFNSNGCFYAPSIKVDVKDSVGAGDSFAAVCVVGLLDSQNEQTIVEAAAKRAAFVCSREGGTPEVPQNLVHPFSQP